MLTILFYILSVLTLFSFGRIVLGPTLWDRLLGFNLFSSKIILLIILYAHIKHLSYLLDIAIVYTLLGFTSITFISRFVGRKGDI